jgi:hypothetical protein
MRTGSPLLLRIFVILLAVANLALLAKRLLPWHDVRNLPVNGTTGIDPMVVLVIYILLIVWISDSKNRDFLRGLTIATGIGVLGGAALAEQVTLSSQPQGQSFQVRVGLLVAAAILTGVAGLLGSRTTKNPGNGIVFGAWCAMVSGMIGCGTVLLKMNVYAQQNLPPDPWKQYQGLAIGNAATQVLVHSLLTATGFILIGPLVGAALGLVFALLGQDQKG